MNQSFASTRLSAIATVTMFTVAMMVGCDASRRSATQTAQVQNTDSETSPELRSETKDANNDPEPLDDSRGSGLARGAKNETSALSEDAMGVESEQGSLSSSSMQPSGMREPSAEEAMPSAEEKMPSADEELASDEEETSMVELETPIADDEVSDKNGETELSKMANVTDEAMQLPHSGPHYRLWLPTTQGPLLVGLEIWVGDLPLESHFSSRIDGLVDELKEPDADSVPWDDLIDHVSSNPEVFGASSRQVSNQKANLKKRYDRNKNDKAERDELVRFVFRDSRFDREFRLFGTDAFRWSNRSQSRLFAAMDRDQDRKLDAEEIAQAAHSITQTLDANADGCIDASEATSLSDLIDDNAWGYRRSHRQGEVAMDLSGYVNWSNLSFAIGGMFGPVEFMRSKDLVHELDANGDRSISKEEAKSLLEMSPAVTLVVRWPSGSASSESKTPVIEWVVDENQTDATVQMPLGDALPRVATESFVVAASINGQARNTNEVPQEAFDQLDANNDGGLDETEIPEGAEEILSLESKDNDGDGKLSYEEIISQRENTRSIWDVQVRGRGTEHPQAIFAWLDTDHDHFLSARELASVPSRLNARLADGTSIKANDFPEVFLLQFVRGEPSQDESRYSIERQQQRRSAELPSWAVKMDSNRDGDISRIEFPGRIDQFEMIDRNGDGFLEKSEIVSVETGGNASPE